MPNDENYNKYRQRDLDASGKSYNSTLWIKVYDEEAGNANGLSYQLVSSMTGNTPKIKFDLPSGVLDVDKDPYITTDMSNQDEPVIKLYLPQSQRLKGVDVKPVAADQNPYAELDTTVDGTINEPMIKFQLPVSQQLLNENVTWQELDADDKPYIVFDAITNPSKPTLVFYLPQSQVMQQPDKVVLDPEEHPWVQDIGGVNDPKLEFHLPRAVKFYYGTLLGVDDSGNPMNVIGTVYSATDSAFVDYGVGDYYINAPTGFIYKVTSKSGDICTFAYQACVQSPLPAVEVASIAPYTLKDGEYVLANPQVNRALSQGGTEWKLEFEVPHALRPAISDTSDFIGAIDEGSMKVDITAPDTMTFDFQIPRGSKVHAGKAVTSGGTVVAVDGAKNGDVYINGETGNVYTLIDGVWQSNEVSLQGPIGETLNIVASYTIKEADGYANTVKSIGDYIDNNYTDDINSQDLFAITYVEQADEVSTAYWYFKVDGKWNFVQLTGGTQGLIETDYQDEVDGDITNKTYSIHYINSLIKGLEDGSENNKFKATYSQAQIEKLLSYKYDEQTLNTWLYEADFKSLKDEIAALEAQGQELPVIKRR